LTKVFEKMTDPARWLGGNAPLSDARLASEAAGFLAGIKKQDRPSLSRSDYSKLKGKSEEGMESKFSLFQAIEAESFDEDGSKLLDQTYSVTMRIEEFRRELKRFDLDDVFTIASSYSPNADFDGDDFPEVGARAVDLFHSYNDVDLETIKKASAFFMRRGQPYHVENLLWSGNKLLNSCDDKLRQKIEEKTIRYSVEHRTGPVYFAIMIALVLASSSQSLRILTKKVENLSLTDIPGENVQTATSFLRGAAEHLSNNDGLPSDYLELVAIALKKCSTKEFTDYITSIFLNHEQGIKKMTLDSFLTDADNKYTALTSRGAWEIGTGSKDHNSAFHAEVTCYRCNKKGHYSRDCPSNRNNGGKGGNGGRGKNNDRGGRGGGRGRNGRGGRGGTSGGGKNKDDIDKTPPKPGEPHRRKKKDGSDAFEDWCGTCARWGNHPTAKHRKPNQQRANTAEEGKEESKDNPAGDFGGLAAGDFGGLAADF